MERGETSSWAFKIIALPPKFYEVDWSTIIYGAQCLVLKSVTDLMADCTKGWIYLFSNEIHFIVSMVAVGEELLRVLNEAVELLQVCADRDSPYRPLIILGSACKFYEIVNNARRCYALMHSLTRSSSFMQSDVQRSLKHLKKRVNHKFNELQAGLEFANEQDRLVLIKRLKSENYNYGFVGIGNSLKFWSKNKILGCFTRHFSVTSLIPMLEPGVLPRIEREELTFLQETLGAGSVAIVFKASWCNLPVAVKVFRNDADFQSELRIFEVLSARNSPYIVQMLGRSNLHTAEKGAFRRCLVLELMDGDLRRVMEKEIRFSLGLCIEIMLEIAEGVKHLHQLDVIYRDLKTSNVLVKKRSNESWQVKLSDFNVSMTEQSFDTGTSDSSRWGLYMAPKMLKESKTSPVGTPLYMAPEVVKGGNYGKTADVYSFGIVCVEILTGALPFKDKPKEEEERELLLQSLSGIDIPNGLKSLLRHCWNDAKDRPHFADICNELWLLKEQFLLSWPSPPSWRKGVPSRKSLHQKTKGLTSLPGSTEADAQTSIGDKTDLKYFKVDKGDAAPAPQFSLSVSLKNDVFEENLRQANVGATDSIPMMPRNWISNFLHLGGKMQQLKLEDASLVFSMKYLSNFVEQCGDCWKSLFNEELMSKSTQLILVAEELLQVMKSVIWHCETELRPCPGVLNFSPSRCEFVQMLDDMRGYMQMINHVLLDPESPRQQLIYLQHSIELNFDIVEKAMQQVSSDQRFLLQWKDLKFSGHSFQPCFYRAEYFGFPVLVTNTSKSWGDVKTHDYSHVMQIIGRSKDENGNEYFILEHMERDLYSFIQERLCMRAFPMLPLLEAINIMIQVAKGIIQLQEMGLPRRDGIEWLDPANIFLKIRTGSDQCREMRGKIQIVKVSSLSFANDPRKAQLYELHPENDLPKDELSAFGFLFSILIYEPEIRLPQRLIKLIERCHQADESQSPSFQTICDQLWMVKEDLLIPKNTEENLICFERITKNFRWLQTSSNSGSHLQFLDDLEEALEEALLRTGDLASERTRDDICTVGTILLTATVLKRLQFIYSGVADTVMWEFQRLLKGASREWWREFLSCLQVRESVVMILAKATTEKQFSKLFKSWVEFQSNLNDPVRADKEISRMKRAVDSNITDWHVLLASSSPLLKILSPQPFSMIDLVKWVVFSLFRVRYLNHALPLPTSTRIGILHSSTSDSHVRYSRIGTLDSSILDPNVWRRFNAINGVVDDLPY